MRKSLLTLIAVLYILSIKAQDNKVWLPETKTTVTTIYDLLEEKPRPRTSKSTINYVYDSFGRSLKSEHGITVYSLCEFDGPNTSIPRFEKYYSKSFGDNSWEYSYVLEREIVRDENGRTTRINVYRTNKEGKTALFGYQTFEYDDGGNLIKYTNVPAINIYMDQDNMEGEDYYYINTYTDFVWGDKLADEPEVGSTQWQNWIVSPKSGLKSYSYTDTLVLVKNNVAMVEQQHKFTYTMDYSNDNYYREESARLYGTNLQVTSVEYYDDLGSHTEKISIYSGCANTADRDDSKLTFVYSADTMYVTPNKYTVTHTENNILKGITFTSENSTYENTYNSQYGYLEQTHASGYEYTNLEESHNFEKTITYSDYKQYTTTAIQHIDGDMPSASPNSGSTLYNMQGQLVGSDGSLLPPGIYITQSGKKIIVR